MPIPTKHKQPANLLDAIRRFKKFNLAQQEPYLQEANDNDEKFLEKIELHTVIHADLKKQRQILNKNFFKLTHELSLLLE